MKPSIGRIVHYQPWHNDEEFNMARKKPLAAIITDVSDGTERVKLECFGALGVTIPARAEFVPHAPDDKPMPGYWNWPPRVD